MSRRKSKRVVVDIETMPVERPVLVAGTPDPSLVRTLRTAVGLVPSLLPARQAFGLPPHLWAEGAPTEGVPLGTTPEQLAPLMGVSPEKLRAVRDAYLGTFPELLRTYGVPGRRR